MWHLDYKSIILLAIRLYLFVYFFLESGKKALRLKAIPNINFPERSHEKQPNKERRHTNIVKDVVKLQNTFIYKSFKELCNCVNRIRLVMGWKNVNGG